MPAQASARCVAAAIVTELRLGARLRVVRELADELVVEGPDKCVTFRVAGPVRPSPPDEPGESESEVEQ